MYAVFCTLGQYTQSALTTIMNLFSNATCEVQQQEHPRLPYCFRQRSIDLEQHYSVL